MSKRIPSLDGIRALAILMVLTIHTSEVVSLPVWWVPDGVSIFFVLSGFLITSLMLREVEKTGTVDLKAFYLRRSYRILPPLYAYLAVSALICYVAHYPIDKWAIFDSSVFIRDYAGNGGAHALANSGNWITEHMWSLSVEEQFYLLYPALFLFVLMRWGRAALAKVTLGILLLTPVLRMGDYALHLFPHRDQFMFHTRMDTLMTGCLIALSIHLPRFERLYSLAARVIWIFPLYTLVLEPLILHRYGYLYYHAIGMTISAVCTGITILWCSRNAETPVGRFLNWKPMTILGVLSYSVYIWQTLFLRPESPAIPASLNFYVVRVAAIIGFALLSYHFVEQPFLRLRTRSNSLPTTTISLEHPPREAEPA